MEVDNSPCTKEYYLADGTIFENIAFGIPLSIDMSRVMWAAEQAQISSI